MEVRAIKIYIATQLDNWKAHNEVRDTLLAYGHTITYDWTTHGPVFGHGLEAVRAVAAKEAEGVASADAVVVLWPGGRGTHVELGMAIALKKQIFFLLEVAAHHFATKETCAFYHHPVVWRSQTLEELYKQIAAFARSV